MKRSSMDWKPWGVRSTSASRSRAMSSHGEVLDECMRTEMTHPSPSMARIFSSAPSRSCSLRVRSRWYTTSLREAAGAGIPARRGGGAGGGSRGHRACILLRSDDTSPRLGNQCPRCGVGHSPPNVPANLAHAGAWLAARAAGVVAGTAKRSITGWDESYVHGLAPVRSASESCSVAPAARPSNLEGSRCTKCARRNEARVSPSAT
mmetsp:Transcript_8243/g.28050  ORF Transcript_8243/g.28050 Transcript_8243/m.28050 type:complete len:206 (-) Transcript_8243:60-677(-)